MYPGTERAEAAPPQPKKLKPDRCGTKSRLASDVFPTKKAKRFKFKISQHILKRKYKRKYYFKCAVKNCTCKFRSVKEWNSHHQNKHSDVKYNCTICGKILNIPCSIKDHKYTNNSKLHICGRHNKGLLSASRLSLH